MTTPLNTPPGTPGAGGVAAVLDQMRTGVRELGETLWAARAPGELMDTVAAFEALRSTLDALKLDVVRELDATHAVKPVGRAWTQDFVTTIAGGHKSPRSLVLTCSIERDP